MYGRVHAAANKPREAGCARRAFETAVRGARGKVIDQPKKTRSSKRVRGQGMLACLSGYSRQVFSLWFYRESNFCSLDVYLIATAQLLGVPPVCISDPSVQRTRGIASLDGSRCCCCLSCISRIRIVHFLFLPAAEGAGRSGSSGATAKAWGGCQV